MGFRENGGPSPEDMGLEKKKELGRKELGDKGSFDFVAKAAAKREGFLATAAIKRDAFMSKGDNWMGKETAGNKEGSAELDTELDGIVEVAEEITKELNQPDVAEKIARLDTASRNRFAELVTAVSGYGIGALGGLAILSERVATMPQDKTAAALIFVTLVGAAVTERLATAAMTLIRRKEYQKETAESENV